MRNIISAVLYIAGFSMIMYSRDAWYLIPFVIWFVGFNCTYVYIISKYMKKHGISEMSKATGIQQGFANSVFLVIFAKWPFYWYNLYKGVQK